ncbi:MAG: hypothetical protein M8863_00910 [marine benthic group bacterium]|nr:hypothetical protein [Gemmatimonadota bacterium]
MRNPISTSIPCICLFLSMMSCSGPEEAADGTSPDPPPGIAGVITFDLEPISEDGLTGPPDGLRSVSYEFCIPADSASAAEVLAIDPSLKLHSGSPGRIGCSDTQTLCIGSTHQPEWRSILERLSALDYVTRIDQTFWE